MTKIDNEPNFLSKAAKVAGVMGAGGLVYLGAQAGFNSEEAQANRNEIKASTAAEMEHKQAIVDSLGGTFDESLQIGDTFTIKQSEGLVDKSLVEIEKEYSDVFKDMKPLIYDDLLTAATFQVIPQPGETFVVVETDVDPDKNNGNEYLPVRENQILHTDVTEIPSPETH